MRLAELGIREPFVESLLNSDDTVREAVIEALEVSGWQPTDEFERARWAVSRTAWAEVVTIGAPAVDYMLQVLLEWDGRWLEIAVKILGEIGDARVVDPLTAFLRDNDEDMADDGSVWLMGRRIHISDRSPIRLRTIDSLGKVGDPRAVQILADILNKTIFRSVRADSEREHAARALGDIGGEAALKVLKAAAENEEVQSVGDKDYRRLRDDVNEALDRLQNPTQNLEG